MAAALLEERRSVTEKNCTVLVVGFSAASTILLAKSASSMPDSIAAYRWQPGLALGPRCARTMEESKSQSPLQRLGKMLGSAARRLGLGFGVVCN